jgi:tetratricopeptide (TPR) repeat protein
MNTSNNFELLVDRLDNNLSKGIARDTDLFIAQNAEVAKEYALLETVAEGLRDAGLHEHVSLIRKRYEAGSDHRTERGQVIHMSFRKTILRVAAVVLLVLFSATTYKYFSVSNMSLYNDYYSSYQLNTSRGSTSTDAIEKAYRNSQWKKVIDIARGVNDKSNKDLFLAGMASMELKQYSAAIPAFEQILERNKQTGDDYFVDETEYYLAMGYLAANQSQKAVALLNSIRNDKNHMFNGRVRKMNLDLKVLRLKN